MSLLPRRRRSLIVALAAVLALGLAVVAWLTLPGLTRSAESGSGSSPEAPATPSSSSPAPDGAPGASPPAPVPVAAAPACDGPGRSVVRDLPSGTVTADQWEQPAPADDVTFDLSGVTSTAYPNGKKSAFAVGADQPALRTCVVGGTIRGNADDAQPWEVYHDTFNGACVRIIAREWMQVRDVRCDNVEDGIRTMESDVNANDSQIYVSGTHLSRIRDDCMENDYTVGGLLQDNLWEQCNTGISERPSGDRSWATPAAETLTLDHMLIGLYQTPHIEDGQTVMGENALFKWSPSANHLVIKCSIFMVDAMSLNGTDAMAVPPGTVVDDSACPDRPSTIVWLGGGSYPAPTAGLRVSTDRALWTDAVRAWKAAHGVA